MKKVFNFGVVNYYGKKCSVKVEAELKTEGEKKVFSASGSIGNECGGQCLDTIAEYVKSPLFDKIYKFWKLYHLNDMHPECEHQAAAGWRDIAKIKAIKYSYKLTKEAEAIKEKAKKRALQALKDCEHFTPTQEESNFYNMPLFLDIYNDTAPENYEPYKSCIDKSNGTQTIKETTLGWVKQEEHPEGILSKPCPVCGYKYGNSWVYFPILENDLKEIENILSGAVQNDKN